MSKTTSRPMHHTEDGGTNADHLPTYTARQRDAAIAEATAELLEEVGRLREALTVAEDKALRFDLDRAGIEHRGAEAVELVELRAQVAALRETVEKAYFEGHRDGSHPSPHHKGLSGFERAEDDWSNCATRAALDAAPDGSGLGGGRYFPIVRLIAAMGLSGSTGTLTDAEVINEAARRLSAAPAAKCWNCEGVPPRGCTECNPGGYLDGIDAAPADSEGGSDV